MEELIPEHIVCAEGAAITVGEGLTVITTVIEIPAQPFAVGVMVYVAVPGLAPVVHKV